MLCHTQEAPPNAFGGFFEAGFPQGGDAQAKVGTDAFRGQRILLFQQGGDVAGEGFLGRAGGFHQHVSDAGMAGKGGHRAAGFRDLPVFRQGAQHLQQPARRGKRRGGRRGQPRQFFRRSGAPGRDIQQDGGKVGFQDFRCPVFRHPRLGCSGPEPVADSRRDTAGASGALGGHIPADAHGLQAAQAVASVVFQFAAQAAVHHGPHSFDGQRSLGDRGGEHDFALARRAGRDGFLLLFLGQEAVQGIDTRGGQTLAQAFRAAADFRFSGQEGQDVTFALPVRLAYDVRDRFGGIALVGLPVGAEDPDGEHPAFAFDQGKLQGVAERAAVKRGGHEDQFQVRPNDPTGLPDQGEGQVGGKAALVEFIENDHVHAVQRGVFDQHARENAFRKDFDACGGRDAGFQAHAITDETADGRSGNLGQPQGDLAGGEAPGLQHQDLAGRWRGAVPGPGKNPSGEGPRNSIPVSARERINLWSIQARKHRQGQEGGFAGAGRGRDDGAAPCLEGTVQVFGDESGRQLQRSAVLDVRKMHSDCEYSNNPGRVSTVFFLYLSI